MIPPSTPDDEEAGQVFHHLLLLSAEITHLKRTPEQAIVSASPETRPILTLTVLIVRPCTFTDSALAAWQPAVEPAEKALYIQLVSEIPL
jgi:hypothetical protein